MARLQSNGFTTRNPSSLDVNSSSKMVFVVVFVFPKIIRLICVIVANPYKVVTVDPNLKVPDDMIHISFVVFTGVEFEFVTDAVDTFLVVDCSFKASAVS